MELSQSDAAYLNDLEERSCAPVFERAFAQPEDQGLPADFLAMLVELDRSKR
jgi:hypothetical protein